jgi:hypothetical protein
MPDPKADSTSRSLVRQILIPLAVMVLGMAFFVASLSTRQHHQTCERACHEAGKTYVREFAVAPVYAPPCKCAEASAN